MFGMYHALFAHNKAQMDDRDNLSVFRHPHHYYFRDPVLRKVPVFACCGRNLNRYYWETLTDNGAVFYSDAVASPTNAEDKDDLRETVRRIRYHTGILQIGRERMREDFLRTCVLSFFFREDTGAIERCLREATDDRCFYSRDANPPVTFVHGGAGEELQWPWPWPWPWPEGSTVHVRALPPALLRKEESAEEEPDDDDAGDTPLLVVQLDASDERFLLCLHDDPDDRSPLLDAAFREYLAEYVRFARDVDYWLNNIRSQRIAPRTGRFATSDVSDGDLPRAGVRLRGWNPEKKDGNSL